MPRNLKLFVLFRALYNCRFYYPVFAILFLDFGLTLKEFAFLNLIWAITIALFEVPSGALADRFGRKPLVVLGAVLMVVEMVVLCFAPLGDSIFWFFLVNRIASGLSEACVSGADEALAYDSIPEGERESRWAKFFPVAMRWVSVGFLISPIVGAFLYDPEVMSRVAESVGSARSFVQQETMRFPLYLNLLTGVAALVVAFSFSEKREPPKEAGVSLVRSLLGSFRETLRAGGWILSHRLVLGLLLFGLLADGFIRMFYTVVSNYYRLIGIEEALFGVLSALATLVGIGTTFFMGTMAEKFPMKVNLGLVAVLAFSGLVALAHPISGFGGYLAVVPMILSMRFLLFFLSHYLNAVTESSIRATILSFKGLAFNLSYGALNLVYGLLLAKSRQDSGVVEEGVEEGTDMSGFEKSLDWWVWAFGGLLLTGLLVFRMTRPKPR